MILEFGPPFANDKLLQAALQRYLQSEVVTKYILNVVARLRVQGK